MCIIQKSVKMTSMGTRRTIHTRGASIVGTNHIMQDAWGATDTVAWVIDGATRQKEQENTLVAQWVIQLNRCLHSVFSTTPSTDPKTGITQAISQARLPSTSPHPSATLALAQKTHTGITTVVLGDAIAWVRTDHSFSPPIRDTRLNAIAQETRQQRRKAHNNKEHELLTTRLLSEEDYWRNREGGFWVVADDPSVVDHALISEHPSATGVLLMTDGAYDNAYTYFPSQVRMWQSLCQSPATELKSLRTQVLRRKANVDDMAVGSIQWKH